ncbi:MAG: flippase-like domain-containing protein [Limisphaerales bacterium]
MKAHLKALLLVCVLALFGWYLTKLGPAKVFSVIAGLGGWAPLVLVPYFVVYIVDCLAWSQTLPPINLPFWTRFRIRWAGESVNNLVPTAYVGGEAAKVLLLRPYGISAHDGAVAAVVSKTAQTVAQLLFIVGASAVFFQLAKDQPKLRLGISFILVGGMAAVGLLFWVQRLGLFRMFWALASAVPWKASRLEKRKERMLELDQTIFGFYRNHRARFYRSTLLYLCGWTLDTVEIYLVAHLLGVPISWPQALVVEAFTGVAKALGMWLPGSLGVQESGIILIGKLVGLPDTFVAAYALIRRARELIFAGVGMILFSVGRNTQNREKSYTENIEEEAQRAQREI